MFVNSSLRHHSFPQGAGHLKAPLYVIASRASQSAIRAIESRGGKVVCKFYNDLALRDCVKGRTDRVSAAPTRREDIRKSTGTCQVTDHSLTESWIEWYTDHRNRGFLSQDTLETLGPLPFVEERWGLLAEQLSRFRAKKDGS
jgi:large subunit ribosomal protein L15